MAAGECSKVLRSIDFNAQNMKDFLRTAPAHEELLRLAISNIPDHPLKNLKSSLAIGLNELCWRTDDGRFYADGADVGDGYRQGNMHALLVGPQNSPFYSDEVLLGFFLLAPRTLYRDHRHAAAEIYIPLTGPNGWRFEQGAWEDHAVGKAIFNAPNVVHATRVYDKPFLSLFLWSRDIGLPCEVIPANDWASIEAQLSN